jgi:hypothetical protein
VRSAREGVQHRQGREHDGGGGQLSAHRMKQGKTGGSGLMGRSKRNNNVL